MTARKTLYWGGMDAFTHMLVVGPTRCGKTATVLKPMIYRLLLAKREGVPLGLSVIEPKGDLAGMVATMCEAMDIPCVYVNPLNPNTHVFNPMQGDIDDVTEATVSVLKGLFGKQDKAFFAHVQEASARKVTQLLKKLRGDRLDLNDVLVTLRDPKILEHQVTELENREGETDLVQYFKQELLGKLAERYREFVIGLRTQLENITGNQHLKNAIIGESSINIDKHFEEGGVFAVNTALGKLKKSGDAFGQFVAMHLQSGTFRRPGTEDSRIPHYLIIDEYSRYINPEVEMFLSIAAEYKTAGIFALQSLGQLEVSSGMIEAKAMKQSIMTSCRNKISFGGLSANDAEEFSKEFGKDRATRNQSTFSGHLPKWIPKQYRTTETEVERFYYTTLMDGLDRFHFVHKLVQDGVPQPPGVAKGDFVPRDWKERLVTDKRKVFDFTLNKWINIDTMAEKFRSAMNKSKFANKNQDTQKDGADSEPAEQTDYLSKRSTFVQKNKTSEQSPSNQPTFKSKKEEITEISGERTEQQAPESPPVSDEKTKPKEKEPVLAGTGPKMNTKPKKEENLDPFWDLE